MGLHPQRKNQITQRIRRPISRSFASLQPPAQETIINRFLPPQKTVKTSPTHQYRRTRTLQRHQQIPSNHKTIPAQSINPSHWTSEIRKTQTWSDRSAKRLVKSIEKERTGNRLELGYEKIKSISQANVNRWRYEQTSLASPQRRKKSYQCWEIPPIAKSVHGYAYKYAFRTGKKVSEKGIA